MVRSSKLEAFAQSFLADRLGEFAKENLKIEYVDVASPSDGIVLLATGRADIMPTSPGAGVMNAINDGQELEMVAPIFSPHPDSKSGLWVTAELMGSATPETFDYASLRGTTIAVAGGQGTTATYTFRKILERGGLTLSDVEFVRVNAPEQLIALENGAVDGAYLLDPFWIEAEKGTAAKFVSAAIPGVSLGGFFFGGSMLEGDPAVGDAFIRALARTTRTHLQGNYHEDPEVVAALVAALEVPEENLLRTPPLVFDPDLTIPEGLMAELQEGYIEEGSLGYSELLPDDRIIDPSFRDRVLGD
jgi:NitT/TauT family transport system substrate-binding protein